mgnify:CR=1 FL=1
MGLLIRWSLVMSLLNCAGLLHAAEEQALVAVWQVHRAVSNDHARVVAACEAFVTKHADDEFVPAVRCIQSWRLLAAGQTNEAVRLLTTLLDKKGTDVARAADEWARAWLTRVDREAVVPALKEYYKAEVRFPARFEDLGKHPRISGKVTYPVADRWATGWKYRAIGFEGVPGFAGQKYELVTNRLGESSDLGDALKLPYGGGLELSARAVPSAGRMLMQMRFPEGNEQPAETTVVEQGQRRGDIVVAYVSPKLVLVRDLLHWKLIPVSRGR